MNTPKHQYQGFLACFSWTWIFGELKIFGYKEVSMESKNAKNFLSFGLLIDLRQLKQFR